MTPAALISCFCEKNEKKLEFLEFHEILIKKRKMRASKISKFEVFVGECREK